MPRVLEQALRLYDADPAGAVIAAALRRAVVLHPQAAIEAFAASNDDFVDPSFPECKPPWPLTWLEWVMPQRVTAQGETRPSPLAGLHLGALVQEVSLAEATVVRRMWLEVEPAYRAAIEEDRETDGRAVTRLALFMHSADAGPLGLTLLDLDATGRLMGHLRIATPVACPTPEHSDALKNLIEVWFAKTILFTFSLCHCRNVRTVPAQAPIRKPTRHAPPRWRIYTLVIDDPRARSSETRRGSGAGVPLALHLCRGHFKTYTTERPLFGKHAGRYWWPMTARGSEQRGVVAKDYAVGKDSHGRTSDPP